MHYAILPLWAMDQQDYKALFVIQLCPAKKKEKNKLKSMGQKKQYSENIQWKLTLTYYLSFDVNA